MADPVEDYREKYEWLCEHDMTIASISRLVKEAGIPEVEAMKMMVAALADQKLAMMKRLVVLEGLAPKRVKLPNGNIMRWDAPDDIVPLDDLKI